MHLLRAEWRKLFSTKLWWGMLLGAIVLSSIGVVAQIASNGASGNPAPPISNPVTQRAIFASATSGYLFSLIVGVIMVTSEYRHFTSRPTFLIEPRRGRVVIAKFVVAAVVGLLYAIVCSAVATAIAVIWLGATGVTIAWTSGDVLLVLLGVVAVVTIYAVVGIGVGVLIRNQIAAVIAALAYLLVVESLIAVIPVIRDAYRFLPGGAARALTAVTPGRIQTSLLQPWQGGLVLFAWAFLFAVLGWLLTVRRDIP